MTIKQARALRSKIYKTTLAEYVEIISLGDGEYILSVRYADGSKIITNN
jgi:hypothetical protein